MIYRVDIGKLPNPEAKEEVTLKVTYDKYGNKFFEFEDIRQRIDIRSNVKSLAELESDAITCESLSQADVSNQEVNPDVTNDKLIPFIGRTYHLPNDADKKYRWVNKRKNMNPMLLTNFKPKDSDDEAPEQYIVYVAIEQPRYKILSYRTGYDILNSFGKKDSHTGCTVVLTDEDIFNAVNDKVIEISFYDSVNKAYKTATVLIDGNGNLEVRVADAYPNEVGKLRTLSKKYKTSLKMRIRPTANKLLTQAFICNDGNDKKLLDIIDEQYGKNEKVLSNTIVHVLSEDDNLDYILSEITKQKITAITTVDVEIPLELLKKYKIRNLFEYDMKTGITHSKK